MGSGFSLQLYGMLNYVVTNTQITHFLYLEQKQLYFCKKNNWLIGSLKKNMMKKQKKIIWHI